MSQGSDVKGKNLVETVQITLSTTPQIEAYLEALVLAGTYGKNTAEAAERLVAQSLEQFSVSGRLQRKKAPSGD